MPVPSTFADLSTTPASNGPSGSDAVNVVDDHLRTVYALIASIYANSGNGWSAPYLPKAGGTATGDVTSATKLQAPRIVATADDDSGTPDAAVKVERTLSGPSTAAGHAFRDETESARTDTSYCSFDAAATITGSGGTSDHYAGFQSRPDVGRNLKYVYNLTSSPTVAAGATIKNNYGLYPYNPTGAGSVENNYGIYIPTQTKGTVGNWALYVANTSALVYIGADTQVTGPLRVGNNAQVFLGALDPNNYPSLGYNVNPVTLNYHANDFAARSYFFDGIKFQVAATGTAGAACTLSDVLHVRLNGATRFVPMASAPTSPVAGDVYFDSGLAKLRCYDGSAWNNLW